MLYKNFESAGYVMPAVPVPGGWNPSLNNPPRECAECFDCRGAGGLKAMWVADEASPTGETLIYAFIQPLVTYKTWSNIMVCWDGNTGDLLWVDRSTWQPYAFGFLDLFRRAIINDEQGRLWSHYLFGFSGAKLLRHPLLETKFSNYPAGQIGMPALMNSDYTLADGWWLNEDGTGKAWLWICCPVTTPVCLSWSGKWILLQYGPYQPLVAPPAGNYVCIHDIETKRRIGYIQTRSKPIRGVAVDSEIAYVFGTDGTIEVLDVPRQQNLGILEYADYSLGTFSGINARLGFSFDRTFRRILVCPIPPDDPVTGCNPFKIYGFAPKMIPENMSPPLPLTVPRTGKPTRVLSRAYGQGGVGIGGLGVTAALLSGDGSIEPSKVSSDGRGFIETYWTPGTSGTDIANIELSTYAKTVKDGLEEGVYIPPTKVAPLKVDELEQEKFLFPGWWLASRTTTRVRTQTASQVFESLLDDYDDNPDDEDPSTYDNNFEGAMMEYSWYDLESDIGVYDTAQIRSDLTYLRSRGLKMIIAIRSGPYDCGPTALEPWVPEYVYNDEFLIYPPSASMLGMTGVFSTRNDPNASRHTPWPMIWHSTVKAQYIGLVQAIVAEFASDDDVVGIVPMDTASITDSAVRNAILDPLGTYGGPYNSSHYWEARRNILSAISGSGNKIVYDWLVPDVIPTDTSDPGGISGGHRDWCKTNGIGLLAPYWFTDYDYWGRRMNGMGGVLSGAVGTIATGIRVPKWSFTDTRSYDCNGYQATPLEILIGGLDMSNETCTKRAADYYKPWMIFIEPEATVWGEAVDEGIMATTSLERLTQHKVFYR